MSLRIRLLLVVATTFAVVVVGSVYAAHVSTRQELRAGDRPLLDPALARPEHRGPRRSRPGRQRRRRHTPQQAGWAAARRTRRDRATARHQGRGDPLDREPARDPGRRDRQTDRRARWQPALSQRHGRRHPVPRPHDRAARRRRRPDRAQHLRHEQGPVDARSATAPDRAHRDGRRRGPVVVDRTQHRAPGRAAHGRDRADRPDAGARPAHRDRPPRRARPAGDELQHDARRARLVTRAATAAHHGREPRAPDSV